MIVKGRSQVQQWVFPGPPELRVWWNQFRPQDPSQIQMHSDTENQFVDILTKENSHVMNDGIILGVWSISVPSMFWSDVEKNERRCRWRRCCCSTVLTRFGLSMPKPATIYVALEVHVVGSVQRRREGRLRVWWREQFTISCAVAHASLTLRVTATREWQVSLRRLMMRCLSRFSPRLFRLPRLTQRPLLRVWWLNTWFQHF